ncbi:hypothetical protein K457DRAFT_23569 [Linnemannia elongata AG-77]|uniref:Uncharacterized protein n=1 Tax=Linnemannia elongata AG-77 TaxID=1314771 RepID=A0A197JIM3_9FUNG|nr:hypothetical protein K457DRAFT_23569 [Linnemannia elongata AG-77]
MSVLGYACRNCQSAPFRIVDTWAGSLMDIQMAQKEAVYMSVNERETNPFLYDTEINPLNNESQWAERSCMLAGSLMDIQMAPKEAVYMSVNEREPNPFLYDTEINPLNNESRDSPQVALTAKPICIEKTLFNNNNNNSSNNNNKKEQSSPSAPTAPFVSGKARQAVSTLWSSSTSRSTSSRPILTPMVSPVLSRDAPTTSRDQIKDALKKAGSITKVGGKA